MGFCDGENDVHGEAVPFPGPLKEENLVNVPKPLPKQLWETKEIQSLSGRPRSCDVGGGSAFPHNGQNIGLSPFLGTLNTGGSLPDLTNLHYSAPLPASLDSSDHLFGSMSVGNSMGNLPAAMTHLGIRSSSEDSSTSLFKDLSSALAGMPEVSLNVDTPFPLEEELQIEPLSLDGLNMLSDSSMGLLDPSVEETFRADRL
ncbi:CREB-regulated transcription coactivator 3 [Camelus dromedarius]|uniref:CREB-regulated transcription coactivator 3 n=1 Tax=Camelus dromedarius TaxID=9838 RepID=A0A5N4CDU5_CAMDR|nr:CREB-regulated transcription coactivator 3 [Camelus dromedarius]